MDTIIIVVSYILIHIVGFYFGWQVCKYRSIRKGIELREIVTNLVYVGEKLSRSVFSNHLKSKGDDEENMGDVTLWGYWRDRYENPKRS